MVMEFSLEHRVGSDHCKLLEKMFHDNERVSLKAGGVEIGLLCITGIDTDMKTGISTFHFSQIRSY